MSIADLAQHLLPYFLDPQPSERWAMYRLIAPVVDYANAQQVLRVFFEYNQTSRHGTSQSVDIALLRNSEPTVLIEAKRADRGVSSEQIAKYLEGSVRGVVANGNDWILCTESRSHHVRLYHEAGATISLEALAEVVRFVRGDPVSTEGWTEEVFYVPPSLKPQRPAKEIKAGRTPNPIVVARTIDHLAEQVRQLPSISAIQNALFESIVEQFRDAGGIPPWLRCEVRSSRVSLFDERLRAGTGRIARIEVPRKQPDVLMLTEIVERWRNAFEEFHPAPHDKGPHMRRFRFGEVEDARQFGRVFVRALVSFESG